MGGNHPCGPSQRALFKSTASWIPRFLFSKIDSRALARERSAIGGSCSSMIGVREEAGETRWWRRQDSNLRPSPCKGDALPTELRPQRKGPPDPDPGPARPSRVCKRVDSLLRCRARLFVRHPATPRDESRTDEALRSILRKEVIQPQVPLRLPCYDLVPVIDLTVGASLPKVGFTTSGTVNFRGLTGGVYKAQEHIHRGVADPRLLAIPTSCRRIAAYNPN